MNGKVYTDAKRGAFSKSVEVGDRVLLKVQKTNKLSSNFHPSPFVVVRREGGQVSVKNEAEIEFNRETSFVKRYNEDGEANSEELPSGGESEVTELKENRPPDVAASEPVVEAQPDVRRISRVIKRPTRFNYFVLS